MKNDLKKSEKIHGLTNTLHVFSKNNLANLKGESDFSDEEKGQEEIKWSPINFYWKPLIELKNELNINQIK